MKLSNLEKGDPRLEFIKMYEHNFSNSENQKNIVDVMVETCVEIRKELDPKIAEELKNLDNQKEFKTFLLAEYKVFNSLPKEEAARVFAEYMLFSLLNNDESENLIDKKHLKEKVEKGLLNLSSDSRNYLIEESELFAWGRLL